MMLLKNRQKLRYLRWWDLLLLTVILFSTFIVTSFSALLSPSGAGTAEALEFTSEANWQAFFLQALLLGAAFLYLLLRGFDFSQWHCKVTPKAILMGVALFIGVALLFDIYFFLTYQLFPYPYLEDPALYVPQSMHPFLQKLTSVDLSLIVYSILNGFYEEIFFLGMCISVAPEKRTFAFLYSLAVRYSFHTYQGHVSALAIGLLLGSIYYLLYTRMKKKNLLPFFLAHTISDILGSGLLSYFIF